MRERAPNQDSRSTRSRRNASVADGARANADAHHGAIATAVDLLRLILAYCLGERGLRSTAAWATAMGLADISNVARRAIRR